MKIRAFCLFIFFHFCAQSFLFGELTKVQFADGIYDVDFKIVNCFFNENRKINITYVDFKKVEDVLGNICGVCDNLSYSEIQQYIFIFFVENKNFLASNIAILRSLAEEFENSLLQNVLNKFFFHYCLIKSSDDKICFVPKSLVRDFKLLPGSFELTINKKELDLIIPILDFYEFSLYDAFGDFVLVKKEFLNKYLQGLNFTVIERSCNIIKSQITNSNLNRFINNFFQINYEKQAREGEDAECKERLNVQIDSLRKSGVSAKGFLDHLREIRTVFDPVVIQGKRLRDVHVVNMTSNANLIVTGSWDQQIFIYKKKTAQEYKFFQKIALNDGWVKSIAISENEHFLIVETDKCNIHIFFLQDGKYIKIQEISKFVFNKKEYFLDKGKLDIALSKDGSILIVGFFATNSNPFERIVGIFKKNEKGPTYDLLQFIDYDEPANSIGMSADGKVLVVGFFHGKIMPLVWNGKNYIPLVDAQKTGDVFLKVEDKHDDTLLNDVIDKVIVNADGSLFFTCHSNKITKWIFKDGLLHCASFYKRLPISVDTISLSLDGTILLVAGHRGTLEKCSFTLNLLGCEVFLFKGLLNPDFSQVDKCKSFYFAENYIYSSAISVDGRNICLGTSEGMHLLENISMD
ncbi:TPA: hypothetical protein DEO28_04240 [Candidatus Dependentiae bacterium]|nr:MAG: hypothetical protein UR14_C0006G0084 [candidate division TM6 bacterium GW2011_GWE2_31_21]KKP53493.1 MAG: hypothetical protein UR43_C0004G0034 [candidate division TM6 bacterium GW2011_GWF2_33_332]HBS48266.1 hypothetical protein [Candidatus Dependentiae bacterium]HBZ73693.1 hypothetical protein [Candidatus Dependentiae bacterium]